MTILMTFHTVAKLRKLVNLVRRFSIMQHHVQQIKLDMQSYFEKSVSAVQPDSLIRNAITVKDNVLIVQDRQYPLRKNGYIIGFGKAVLGMARETERILGDNLCTGIISIPEGSQETMKNNANVHSILNSKVKILEGGRNNLPDKNSEEAARQIKKLVEGLNQNDLLIVLVSGGGSALLPLPLPPITLEEKCRAIKLLASAGANINELNSVRKKLSVLKGGGLARLAYPAQVISLILSDIVHDPLDLIASGPTVLNKDSPDIPLNILRKYSLLDKIPASIKQCLNSAHSVQKGQVDLDNIEKNFNAQNVIIGSNLTAVSAVADAAIHSDYHSVIMSTEIEGLVTEVGKMYATVATSICSVLHGSQCDLHAVFQSISRQFTIRNKAGEEVLYALHYMKAKKGICLVAGGETTVIVKGSGLGGRNQELAMVFARCMNENAESHPFLNQFHVVLLSAGTDGIDGPTDAAGAFGYGNQFKAASKQNLNPIEYENNNDSYNFYSELNEGEDLVVVGHTGTNVMDVHILVIEPHTSNV
ncbi:glycerate kinase [Periplaneta americana]|uniref:glycerate kinase n=1 Tax=Periplaneta americana TaxID=6978 RepID=UPI0037E82AAF